MNSLITKALQKRKLEPILTFPEILMNEFELEVIQWLRKYILKNRQPPSLDRLCREFPSFSPIESADPLVDILHDCLLRKRQNIARQYIDQANAIIDDGDDPTKIIIQAGQVLTASAAELMTYTTFDRQRYFDDKKFLPFSIGVIDRLTSGIGNGELCYLAGTLGSYKTTLLEHITYQWWKRRNKILFISNEALPATIFSHFDAILGRFNPSLLRSKSDSLRSKVDRISTVLSSKRGTLGEIIIPGERLMTPDAVISLAAHLRVDAIVIDGVYLMKPDNDKGYSQSWERMAAVSRGLKQGALALETRVLGVLQRRKGASEDQSTDDVAYSNSFSQDADIVLSVWKEKNTLTVTLIKNREGANDIGTVLEINHANRSIKDLNIDTSKVEEVDLDTTTGNKSGE